MQIHTTSRYRAYYHPPRAAAIPALSDTGVLPFVQFQAANAEHAHRVAHALTGCPISEVERLEGAAA